MFRFMKKMSRKAGLPPGTLVHLGDKPAEAVTISLTHYNSDSLVEEDFRDVEACEPRKMPDGITWIYLQDVYAQQPDERGHEGPHHHCHHLYPLDLHCRHLRNEFRNDA